VARTSVEFPFDATQLLKQVQDAERVEIAFVDEGKEIEELPAREIRGHENWIASSLGLMLCEDIDIGPLPKPIKIEGYGLFLDGKLVAYQERFEPLEIQAGTKWSLKGDVVF
jgi:hypothetical protein